MKSTFGQSVTLTIAGESHGAALTAILAGLAPGIPVDESFIAAQLDKRRPAGAISTARQESDPVEILSGVYQGCTTGTPITLLIRNRDTRNGCRRPCDKRAVAVFAKYVCVYLLLIDMIDFRKSRTQTNRIEQCSRTEHLILRQSGIF